MTFPLNRHRLWQRVADAALIAAAWYLAFQLRFDFNVPPRFNDALLKTTIVVVGIKLAVFVAFGFYNRWWRYVSTRDIWRAALGVLVDGPPGVTVKGVKNRTPNRIEATFEIAPDAVPGRRSVRVLSERSGLTNMLYFTVGRLPEVREKEPNDTLATAQAVTLPVVVNGRIDPQADADCFRFRLKKGQRLAAAVLAHLLEAFG